MGNLAQRSFTSGELAPALHARTDIAKYATGLRTCRNFVVHPAGGVSNRPGTEFVCEVKQSANQVRLIEFVFNADQTYVLEFGHQYMRVVRAGAPIVVASAPDWNGATAYAVGTLATRLGVIYYSRVPHTNRQPPDPDFWYALAGTVYEIPTPYVAADLGALQFVQSADVVTLVHPSYPPMNLARSGHTAWTLTPISFAPSILPPADFDVTGGGAGAALWWAVTSINTETGEESLARYESAGSGRVPSAATPTNILWSPVAGAGSYNVYRSADGTTYGFVGTASKEQATPLLVNSTVWTTLTGNVTRTTAGTSQSVNQARITVVSGGADKAANGVYTIRGRISVEVFTGDPPSVTARARAFYSRDGEPRVDAGVVGTVTLLPGSGGFAHNVPFVGDIVVPEGSGYSSLVIDVVAEIETVTGDDAGCEVSFATAPDNSVSRQIVSTQLKFIDTGATPDLTIRPPVARNPFNAIGRYPSAVGYYQQRRVFGNSNVETEKVWTSRSGAFNNFMVSTPIQDDDAVTFALAGREVNAVRHLLDLNKLLVLTAGGVWSIEGDGSGVLTPTGVNARQRSYVGAGSLRPVVVGNRVLYVDARAPIIRELVNDEVAGMGSADLTVFSGHLFTGHTIVDLDVQFNAYTVAWAVRSDGVLLGLTYLPEQQVWGWHRHDTEGTIERVCVVPEGAEDAVYLVVRRTIDGTARRYIERMASRRVTDIADACFLDCSAAYDGRNMSIEPDDALVLAEVSWGDDEEIVLTVLARRSRFTEADVGNVIVFTAADGSELRCTIIEYGDSTVVVVRPNRDVPADLLMDQFGPGTLVWTMAVDQVSGLDHLEGRAVSVVGDGMVVANALTDAAPLVVVDGAVTLPRPYTRLRVGLPYFSDIETLDIDTPAGPSKKDRALHIGALGLSLLESRGVFAGAKPPRGSDPIEGLEELKPRDPDDGYVGPPRLLTETVHLTIGNTWNSNGRVFVRQVDPLPVTILALIPQGAV